MKKIKITLTALVAFAVAIVLLTQVVFTIKVSPLKAECIAWDATFVSIENQAEQYNFGTLDDATLAYSFTGELPSRNPNDYMNIYCYFDTANLSFIDKYSINATLKNAEKYPENILFVSNANTTYLSSVDRRDSTNAYIILDVYIGTLDEEQIKELVEGLEITVKAYGDYFGTREKVISYKECKNITVEFAQ